MIRRIKEWWKGPEKYRKAGVEITDEYGVLYKRSIDILNSTKGSRLLEAFCELDKEREQRRNERQK